MECWRDNAGLRRPRLSEEDMICLAKNPIALLVGNPVIWCEALSLTTINLRLSEHHDVKMGLLGNLVASGVKPSQRPL